MDINMEKQNITVCEDIKNEKLEQTIDSELMLPDFCPDIARVLKCCAKSRIVSKRFTDSVLNIDGAVFLTVIYVDDDGNIRSFEQSLSYYREVDIGSNDNLDADIKTRVEYINCRALTPRKLEIHGTLSLNICISKLSETDFVSNVSDKGLQLCCTKKNNTTVVAKCEKFLTVNDELEISASDKPIASILRNEALVESVECKAVTGKAVVKGNLRIRILYCTDVKLRVERIDAVIPFTQITDIDGLDEQCLCNAVCEVTALEIRPRTGLDGEVRNIAVSAGINVKITATREVELCIASDAYSVDREIDVVKETGHLSRRISRIDETYLSRHDIELPREIATVMDVWSEAFVSSVGTDKNRIIIKGTLQISMLACDCDSTPLYIEKTVEFSYEYPLENITSRIDCRPQICVGSCGYALTGSTKAEVRVELIIHADIFEPDDTQIISDIIVTGEKQMPEHSAALTIYYAHSNEAVFDIARKYNTTVAAVTSANNLEVNRLEKDTMLLIPSV